MFLSKKVFAPLLSRHILFLGLLSLIHLLALPGLCAQRRSPEAVFGKFRLELDQFKSSEMSPPVTASTKNVQEDVAFLKRKVAGGAHVTPEYLISLESNAQLIDAAQKNPLMAPRLLAAAEQDLQIKVENARTSTVLGNVQVKVVTKKDGKEVSDYYVRCNPRVDGEREPCKFPLNNPSSPTIGELPPGVLLMWTVKGGKKSSVAQPKIVDGKTNPQVIVLEIP